VVSPWDADALCLSLGLAWPFYAMPYAVLASIALRAATVLGWALIAYVASVSVLRRQRLKGEFLPEFFDAVKDIRAQLSNRE